MRVKVSRIAVLLAVALVTSLAFALPVAAADFHVYPGDSIQASVDGASDGDVIYVHEGTYAENVLIDGVDVSLVAVGDVTISGASDTYANKTIAIYNSECTIDGFTVTSNGCAIYARGSAAAGDGDVSVTIVNNYVTDYMKNGITVNCELATGFVKDNVIESDADSVYAQNGIQFGYGATGQVLRNTVETDYYLGDDWTASGILIFESDGVSVKKNTVSNCQTGIGVQTWGWFCPTASGNVIANNTVTNADWGISVFAYAWDGYSGMDSAANNNKIVNNSVSGSDNEGSAGIEFGIYDNSEAYDAEAWNNKVINNDVSDFETPWYDLDSSATKIHANSTPAL